VIENYTSSVRITLATLVVAEIINGLPPVATHPAPQATRAVQRIGYFITGGVQFKKIFLTPIGNAPEGEVVLETSKAVLVRVYAAPK
jgi:hypothetical protein